MKLARGQPRTCPATSPPRKPLGLDRPLGWPDGHHPMLGIVKERLAGQFRSAAIKGEGRQNMLCAYPAAALLVGLLGNASSSGRARP